MTPRQIAKVLGITDLNFEDLEKRGEDFALHQVKRRVRYFCFALQRRAVDPKDDVRVPRKFIEHFEALPQFEGWAKFGVTWDVVRDNPLEVYARDFSISEEWEATIRRVVPELPVDRVWRQRGPEGNL